MQAARNRDRTWFAAVALVAAVAMVVASFLPWFRFDTDRVDAWHAVDGAVMLVVPPIVVAATTLVGLCLEGRSKFASPIAFGLALLWPLGLLANPGAVDYTGNLSVSRDYGLWLECAAGLAGLSVSLCDARFAGATTAVSRLVGRPSLLASAAGSAVIFGLVFAAVADMPQEPRLATGLVLVIAIAFGAPTWPVRLLAALIELALASLLWAGPGSTQTVAIAAVLAGYVAMLGLLNSRRTS